MRTLLPLGLVLLTSLGVACSSANAPSDEPAVAEVPASSAPTYYQDVAPILHGKCGGCHVQGGVAPFSTETMEGVMANAEAIKSYTGSRTMPPWPPGALSPAFARDRSLTDAQIALIGAWVDAKMPLGDPSRPGVALPIDVVDIGTPEASGDIGADFLPDPTLIDEYRCFLVDPRINETRTAVGMKITPTNAEIVHHVSTAVYPASAREQLSALSGKDGLPGWSCFGGFTPKSVTAQSAGSLGGWLPGNGGTKLPAGTGNPVEAGSLVVMQIHFHAHGRVTAPDRSKLEISFAPKGTEGQLKPLRGVRLLQKKIQLPAETKGIVAAADQNVVAWTGNKFPAGGRTRILGISGHMHLLGTRFTITMTSDAGPTTLLDIPSWDYHWQGEYELTTPVLLKATDTLSIRCEYDNTSAHRSAVGYTGASATVTGGESTEEEMCTGLVRFAE